MFGRVILRCSEEYSSNATLASTYSTPTTLVLNAILNSENLWDRPPHNLTFLVKIVKM